MMVVVVVVTIMMIMIKKKIFADDMLNFRNFNFRAPD